MATVSLAFIPGHNYPRRLNGEPDDFTIPGCYNRKFNVHEIFGFKSVPAANVRGFYYYRIGYAKKWWINRGWS